MTNKIKYRDMMAKAFVMSMFALILICLLATLCGCRVVEVENKGEEIARDADGKPVLLQDGSIQTVKRGWSVYHGQHWMTTEADSLTALVRKDEINFAFNGLNTEPSEQLGVVIDKSVTGVALLAEKVGAAIVSGGGSVATDAAQELVRVRQSRMPRDWRQRWQAAGGKIYDGRMIALVEDEIWRAISKFDLPYPPFDWGSGMGIKPVSYDEAVRLKVIDDDYVPAPADTSKCDINHDLSVSTKGMDKSMLDALKDAFGDQISIRGNEMNWQPGIIRKRLHGEGNAKVNLGKAQGSLLAKLPSSVPYDLIAGNRLSVPSDWIRTHGQKHLGEKETDKRNIPLQESDYDLIPTLWHNPDSVLANRQDPYELELSLDTFDGGTLKLGINVFNGPYVTTFHKMRNKKSQK